MSWLDITIKAVPPTGRCKPKGAITKSKIIIDNVSGTVRPGEFLAIIGASGAGKTTLLNFLSGREISMNLEKTGRILVNGTEKETLANFSAFSAYVQQDDILFQTMTVRECLEFAARLKLPGTEEQKIARVNFIIATLKLTKCQNTRIGGPLVKGVSGGERKRTSIGVELITDPSLIFLDEPTTGLDSFTATSVMETLGDLARKDNRTVISTIHQPNSDIFEMFDLLMLLAKGKIIYFNKASLSVDFFTSIGYQCPELSNPCDFFMSMMSKESIELDHEDENQVGYGGVDHAKIEVEYQKLIAYFDTKYETSELRNDATFVDPKCPPIRGDEEAIQVVTPWCYQWRLLATRNFLNIVRLPQTSYVKLLTTCVTALFACLLFWQSGALPTYSYCPSGGGACTDCNVQQTNPALLAVCTQGLNKVTQQAVQNIQGALFFMTMNVSFNAIQNVILIFPDERPVFLREVNNNMYKVGPYFWAKVISEMPFSIITPSIFGCIVYFSVGLNNNAGNFFLFLLSLILIYNASSGYSLIISSSFSDKQLAVTLTPVLIIPFMLFAGFFVASSSIPKFLKEFEYLSIFKYGYQALMQNQFQPNNPSFNWCEYPQDFANQGGTPNTTLPLNNVYCQPKSQIANQSFGSSLGCLAAIYAACYLLSWWILQRLSKTYE